MPPGNATAEEEYRRIRDEANDYHETVQTLLAFAAFVCHDGQSRRTGSHFGFGRRMTTSSANRVSPNAEITPDCITQKESDYGIVAEAKKQISRATEQWDAHVAQLRKYDDQLTGWWTESQQIAKSDAALLIHQSRGRAFTQFLQSKKDEDPLNVGEHTSVIEFNRSDEGQSYIFFRLEWGVVNDRELAEKLQPGVQVPVEKVLRSFPNILFYDAPPPIEDLMTMLWMDWLFSRFDPALVDPASGTAALTVTVSEITSDLQQAYGSKALEVDQRSAEFPRSRWVREALDAFVGLEMATAGGDGETYIVKYKTIPKEDVLERFVRLRRGPRATDTDPGQLPLLPAL